MPVAEDQTGRNLNEQTRIQSEHPRDEAEVVVQRGRVLGGLEPSRAFGDARYKWPRAVQEKISALVSKLDDSQIEFKPPPKLLKTPPYVTSEPVVTHRKLSFLPLTSNDREPQSSLRFVVLATDGLWDQLSSTEVVALVAGYFEGIRGIVPKAELRNRIPTSSHTASTETRHQPMRSALPGESWAFVDDNVSTHLIRNACGGGNHLQLQKLLSIPAPYARSHKDDITVTVIWWEDGRISESAQSSIVKAKL